MSLPLWCPLGHEAERVTHCAAALPSSLSLGVSCRRSGREESRVSQGRLCLQGLTLTWLRVPRHRRPRSAADADSGAKRKAWRKALCGPPACAKGDKQYDVSAHTRVNLVRENRRRPGRRRWLRRAESLILNSPSPCSAHNENKGSSS